MEPRLYILLASIDTILKEKKDPELKLLAIKILIDKYKEGAD